MITPELIVYMRGEFAKGKTREEIRTILLAEGGWDENDLSEAFRITIPMHSVAPKVILPKVQPIEIAPLVPALPSRSSPLPRPSVFPPPLHLFLIQPLLKFLIILVILSGLGFISWYYRSTLINFWKTSVNKISELPFFPFKD